MAISSPLLEDLSIDGAHGVLINITGGPDLTLFEVNEASTLIQEAAHEDANIIFGAVIDDQVPEGAMRVTVIATGLDTDRVRRGRDSSLPMVDGRANVTPLRPTEPATRERAPAAEVSHEMVEATIDQPETPLEAEKKGDFLSPYDDELDVPTFIRRGDPRGEEEDSEEPAFLRRSAD